MRVFISWSGERSRQIALLFRWWLKCVVQSSDPWMSSEDIESESIWFNEIGDQLSSTTIGIVCLTQENKNKPWILFETGALMKGLSKSRVCPFLIDLENQDVSNPLAQFNLAYHDKEGVFRIVKAVNNSLADKALDTFTLEQVFATYWPQFDSEYNRIIASTINQTIPEREESDILKELLLTVRSFDKRISGIENKNLTTNIFSQSSSIQPRPLRPCNIVLKPDLGQYDTWTMLNEMSPILNIKDFANVRNFANGDQQIVEFLTGENVTAELILSTLKGLGYNVIAASIG